MAEAGPVAPGVQPHLAKEGLTLSPSSRTHVEQDSHLGQLTSIKHEAVSPTAWMTWFQMIFTMLHYELKFLYNVSTFGPGTSTCLATLCSLAGCWQPAKKPPLICPWVRRGTSPESEAVVPLWISGSSGSLSNESSDVIWRFATAHLL